MIKLFDNVERTFMEPAKNRVNTYDYYNISGRRDISIIRDKLEEWFSDIPENDKYELKKRFRKRFDPVFFEVFLFQLFKSLGFKIMLHPSIEGTDKKPDFLIKKDNLEIYVEAKVSNDQSQIEEGKENRLNQFYDSLDKIRSENFVLYIDHLRIKTDMQPNTREVIKHIEHELKLINPDSIALSNLPEIKYCNDEIDIIVKPMPVVLSSRGKIKRAIGMKTIDVSWGGSEESIRESINKKVKRYGVLDKPYIVCINALSVRTSSVIDVENAIWGPIAFTPDNKLVRKIEGVFYENNRVKNVNLSGVLVTKVFPENVPTTNYWLFKHPFSGNTFDFNLLGLKLNYLESNIIYRSTGDDFGDILNIEKDWLEK